MGPETLHNTFTVFQFLLPSLSVHGPNLLVKSSRVRKYVQGVFKYAEHVFN